MVYVDVACRLFAVIAHSKAAEDPRGARQLGVASIVLSVIGLIVGIILLIVMAVFFIPAAMEVSGFHLLYSSSI